MMGTKIRSFAPLCNRSVDDLVPSDNFYRHLEAKLDLGFVRDLVHSTYAVRPGGLSPFLRGDRGAVPRGRAGLG